MKSEIREYRRAKRKQSHIKRKGRLDPRTGRPGKRK